MNCKKEKTITQNCAMCGKPYKTYKGVQSKYCSALCRNRMYAEQAKKKLETKHTKSEVVNKPLVEEAIKANSLNMSYGEYQTFKYQLQCAAKRG